MKNKKKILIIDDEPDMVKMITTRLNASGYDIVSTIDGSEGLQMAIDMNPDLVLLDIKMAQVDGYTMLRKIKQNEITKRIPVIILTAYDKMQDLFEREGIADYIVKPFEDKDLLMRITKALSTES